MSQQYTFDRVKDGYTELWETMRVLKGTQAVRAAKLIQAGKARYQEVQKRTGVPWFVIGLLHYREANCNFNCWLHNGDPMRDRAGKPVRTVQVPPNRPKNPDCSWEDGAVDALVFEHLDSLTNWCIELVAWISEKFNGWGYRNPKINIPSPYLWGGTSVQKKGKFGPRDHEYNATLMDPQLGTMAILKVLMELDPEARFEAMVVEQPEPVDDEPAAPSLSPKASEGEAQETPSLMNLVRKSQTIKGTLTSFFVSMSGWFSGFIDKLHDPVNLALFIVAVIVACYAVWLAVSGRINAQKIIAHLSVDNLGG